MDKIVLTLKGYKELLENLAQKALNRAEFDDLAKQRCNFNMIEQPSNAVLTVIYNEVKYPGKKRTEGIFRPAKVGC